MIGIYGIVASEEKLPVPERAQAIRKMSHGFNESDFYCNTFTGNNFSVGVTKRWNNKNLDLYEKTFGTDMFVAYCGYGKRPGAVKMSWAKQMVESILELFRYSDRKAETLCEIQGSYYSVIISGNQLLILSDRFGSKNLYYYFQDEVFIFAPDVGRIVQSGLVPRNQNHDGIVQILVSGFFLDNQTLVKGVFRFPHATLSRWDIGRKGALQEIRYWNIPFNEGRIKHYDSELVGQFYESMKKTISSLRPLDENAAVMLSGGLDSRAISLFVAKKAGLNFLTYDGRDEMSISRKVCRHLSGNMQYFSDNELKTTKFLTSFFEINSNQRLHCVLNQYFHAPFLKEYFASDRGFETVYDGVYLDGLFNVAYDCLEQFGFEDFAKIYGGESALLLEKYTNLRQAEIIEFLKNKYNEIEEQTNQYDDVGRSQYIYFLGRLRRYVNEACCARENYCYVLKPAYDYELSEFAFNLKRDLRAGKIYLRMLKQRFPDAMKIRFKDQYAIREAKLSELMVNEYKKFRLRLSNLTKGRIGYYPYQVDYFLFKAKGLLTLKEGLLGRNFVKNFANDSQLSNIFEKSNQKLYMLNIFQRFLFVQQFYHRYF